MYIYTDVHAVVEKVNCSDFGNDKNGDYEAGIDVEMEAVVEFLTRFFRGIVWTK